MPGETSDIPAKKLELYEALVATQPDLPRRGKANPYTSLNGHMFSYLGKQGKMALRLPLDELEAFLKKYKTKRAVAHGTVMKEYADVPDKLLKNTKELAKYFAISVDYIASLKPKPTTRKASKKKKKVAKKAGARKKVTRKKTVKKKVSRKKAVRR